MNFSSIFSFSFPQLPDMLCPITSRLWYGFKVSLFSFASAFLPTALLLTAATITYFVFPPLASSLLGFALGWFILDLAVNFDMYYHFHCFVLLRTAAGWIEKRFPYLELIILLFASVVGFFCWWMGIVIMILPGGYAALKCQLHQLEALQTNSELPV